MDFYFLSISSNFNFSFRSSNSGTQIDDFLWLFLVYLLVIYILNHIDSQYQKSSFIHSSDIYRMVTAFGTEI